MVNASLNFRYRADSSSGLHKGWHSRSFVSCVASQHEKFGCSLRVWDENPAACRSGELQPLDSVPGDLERDKKVKETDQWSWCADQYGNICTSSPKRFCSWSSLIREDRYLNTGPVWWMWISICNTGSLLEFVFVLWEEWMMVKQTTELEH